MTKPDNIGIPPNILILILHRAKGSAPLVLDALSARFTQLRDIHLDTCSLRGVDFTGADIARIVLNTSPCHHSKFDSCFAECADFKRSNLTGCSFKNANLRGADFRAADLTDVDFTGADITDAIFDYAILNNTKF